MPKLKDEIDAAEAHLAMLKRRALGATCAEVGHDWRSIGGRNACCEEGSHVCACSVPVYECTRCHDCDYGENDEAEQIKLDCAAKRELVW